MAWACPPYAAATSAVAPSLLVAFTSAPFASSARIAPARFDDAADISGVMPSLSFTFTSAPAAIRASTAAVCPSCAATASADSPS